MEKKDMKMDRTVSPNNRFSKKFRSLLYVTIFLTGICGFWGGYNCYRIFASNVLWTEMENESINMVVWEALIYIVMLFFFVSLIRMVMTKKPFTGILVNCLYAVGILIVVGSVLFPNLPFYQMPHLIMGREGKPYIDGLPFVIGLLILIFGKIVQYGFDYQKDIDMTI